MMRFAARVVPNAIGEYTGPYPENAAQAMAAGAGSAWPTVLIATRFPTNRPIAVGAAATHVAMFAGRIAPLQITPFAGLMVTVAPFAFNVRANVSRSANGMTPGRAGVVCGSPMCSAGRTWAMAVARTVRPSRRTEYADDGSSPRIIVPLPNTNGSDAPPDATFRSAFSVERRSRTRNALSSTSVKEPELGRGHGSGGGSSAGGHDGRPSGGCGVFRFGLKSFLAYGPLPFCGSVHTIASGAANASPSDGAGSTL